MIVHEQCVAQEQRILYVGGKSGGHIIPALTLARRAHVAGAQVAMVALDGALDHRLLDGESMLDLRCHLQLSTIRTRQWWNYPRYCYELLRALWRIRCLMYAWKPTEVVATGGYLMVPVALVAWMRGIPVTAYALDAEPGAAITYAARLLSTVVCVFRTARDALMLRGIAHVKMGEYPCKFERTAILPSGVARERLAIAPGASVVTIFGGSQGAQMLNEQILATCTLLGEHERVSLYVLHQVGGDEAYAERIRQRYAHLGVRARVCCYVDDVIPWLSAADIIVTRAGSGALHEAAMVFARLIIVPLVTSATRHQVANARAFVAENPANRAMLEAHDARTLVAAVRRFMLVAPGVVSDRDHQVPSTRQ